jgi:hypothetical protein
LTSSSNGILLFPEKEAKSVCSASQKALAAQPSAKPTLGVWGRAPRKSWANSILLFPEKEAKSVVPLRGRLCLKLILGSGGLETPNDCKISVVVG